MTGHGWHVLQGARPVASVDNFAHGHRNDESPLLPEVHGIDERGHRWTERSFPDGCRQARADPGSPPGRPSMASTARPDALARRALDHGPAVARLAARAESADGICTQPRCGRPATRTWTRG